MRTSSRRRRPLRSPAMTLLMPPRRTSGSSGRATITKVDADTGKAAPQGDATLNGAEYTLYKSGKEVATYTISNGGFTTDLFPCTTDDGVYTLKETKAPSGYKLDETVYKLKPAMTTTARRKIAFL